jgi:hypothetical protein
VDPPGFLISLFREYELNWGIERSAKLSAGRLEAQRLLITPDGRCGLPALIEILDHWCCRCQMPDTLQASVRLALPDAQHVHFGLERSGTGHAERLIAKCYVELPPRGWDPESVALQFVGCKWSPEDPGLAVVTWYHSLPVRSRADLLRQFAEAGGDAVARMIEPLLLLALSDCPDADLREHSRLLRVTEDGNPRVSYDLNAYGIGQTVADVASAIAPIGRQLAIADADVAGWLTRSADCRLGHIAAGTDRHGRPFVTVYYGADDGQLHS